MGGESIGTAERTAQLMGRLRTAVKAAGTSWKGLDWEPSHKHVSVFARRLWAMLEARTRIEMPEMDRPGERPWWDFDPVMVSPCGREEAISRSRALQQLSLDVEMGVSLEALPTICAEAQRLTEIEATAAAADAERALGYGQRALMAAEQGDYRAAYEASLEAVALERHYRDVGQVHVWSSVLHLVELLEALRAGAGSTTPTSSVWLYMFFAENEYEGRVFRRLVTLPFVPESGLELKLGEGPLGLTFTLEDLMYDLTDGTFVAVESGPLEDIPLFEENGFVEELQPGKARRPKRWDARE